MDSCKVELRVADRSLAVEGSAAFVSETLDTWKGFFGELLAPPQAKLTSTSRSMPEVPIATAEEARGHTEYENVYDSADGKLKIIAQVPGKNKAELTRNTALVLLFGRLLNGVESVPSENIREACSDQGCYDPTNFAQYLRGLKSKVVMNTKHGGGYDVKLTAPGRKEAKELVETLNTAE